MISPEKINEARQSGYNNSEIADFLSSSGYGDQINEARQSGYSDDEILGHLEGSQPAQAAQEQVQSQIQPQQPANPYDKYHRSFGRDIGLAARTGLQAAASPVTLLGDLTTMAGNAATGTKTQLPSEIVSQQLTKLGLPEANTPGERIATNVAEAATGSGLTSRAIRKYGPALAQKFISSTPKIDAAIGGGAAATSNITKEAGGGTGAQIGAGLIGGLIGGRAGISKPSKTNAGDIKKLSSDSYKVAEEAGANIPSKTIDSFLDHVESVKPRPIAGTVLTSEDKKFINSINEFEALRGKGLNYNDAERIDRALANKADSFLGEYGRITNEARQIMDIQSKFRDLVDNSEPLSKVDRLTSKKIQIDESNNDLIKLNDLKTQLVKDTEDNALRAAAINRNAAVINDPVKKIEYYQTLGFKNANNSEISDSVKELQSLRDLEKDLIDSVQTNTKSAALNTTFAKKQSGFWKNRTLQDSGKLLTMGGDEAKSLSNVRQQITNQENIVKDHASRLSNEYLGESASGAKNISNIQKQISGQESALKKLQNEHELIVNDKLITGKEGIEAGKKARGLWSASMRLGDVEKIITRAEMMDNPATGLKTGFRNLYNNPARMRGFSPDEKKLIKNAAESGVVTDALRTLGSRIIPIGAAISGNGIGGIAASQIGTMAARGAATKMQLNKANKLADAIANKAIPQPKQPKRYSAIPISIGINSPNN